MNRPRSSSVSMLLAAAIALGPWSPVTAQDTVLPSGATRSADKRGAAEKPLSSAPRLPSTQKAEASERPQPKAPAKQPRATEPTGHGPKPKTVQVVPLEVDRTKLAVDKRDTPHKGIAIQGPERPVRIDVPETPPSQAPRPSTAAAASTSTVEQSPRAHVEPSRMTSGGCGLGIVRTPAPRPSDIGETGRTAEVPTGTVQDEAVPPTVAPQVSLPRQDTTVATGHSHIADENAVIVRSRANQLAGLPGNATDGTHLNLGDAASRAIAAAAQSTHRLIDEVATLKKSQEDADAERGRARTEGMAVARTPIAAAMCACQDCSPLREARADVEGELVRTKNWLKGIEEARLLKVQPINEKLRQAQDHADKAWNHMGETKAAILEIERALNELTGGGALTAMTADLSFTPVAGWPEYSLGGGRSVWARTPEALKYAGGAMAVASLQDALNRAEAWIRYFNTYLVLNYLYQGDLTRHLDEVWNSYEPNLKALGDNIEALERDLDRVTAALERCEACRCPVVKGKAEIPPLEGTSDPPGGTAAPAPPPDMPPPREPDLNSASEIERARERAAARDTTALEERKRQDERQATIAADEERMRKQAQEQVTARVEQYRSQLRDAIARGDKAEQRRIEAEWDALHDETLALFDPTEAEKAAMEAKDVVRARIASRMAAFANAVVDQQLPAIEAWQRAKEAVTGWTQYVSSGSELQQETSRSTRQANSQLVRSQANLTFLLTELHDPNLDDVSRAILHDMLKVALVAEDGAQTHLRTNGLLTAAGYTIDVALTATGLKVLGLAKTGVTTLVSRLFGRASTMALRTAVKPQAARTLAKPAKEAIGAIPELNTTAAAARGARRFATRARKPPETIEEVLESLAEVNPRGPGPPNCHFCADGVESLLRGKPARPAPRRAAGDAERARNYGSAVRRNPAELPATHDWIKAQSFDQIESMMRALPPGSHGRVKVLWKRTWNAERQRFEYPGHEFNVWTDKNGKVYFIDGQSGSLLDPRTLAVERIEVLLTNGDGFAANTVADSAATGSRTAGSAPGGNSTVSSN